MLNDCNNSIRPNIIIICDDQSLYWYFFKFSLGMWKYKDFVIKNVIYFMIEITTNWINLVKIFYHIL